MKLYFARDPDRWKAVRAAKYAAGREEDLARSRAYRAANRVRLKQYERQRYARDRASIVARYVEWRKANPDCRTRWNSNRRALKLGMPGVLSRGIIRHLFLMQDGACATCQRKDAPFELDHIIPLSRCGANDDQNVQLLCGACNRSKGSKLPSEMAAIDG